MANPAETAYLSVRDRELSNAVQLVEFRRRKVAVHTFLGWSQAGQLRRPSCRIIESHNLFVFGPILVKFHIRTRQIESFPTTFRSWWCAKEKLHFTAVHTLRQLKRDEALFHHFGGLQSFERGTGRYLYAGFGGIGKIWRPCDKRLQGISAFNYTHSHTHKHTHTHTHTHTQGN